MLSSSTIRAAVLVAVALMWLGLLAHVWWIEKKRSAVMAAEEEIRRRLWAPWEFQNAAGREGYRQGDYAEAGLRFEHLLKSAEGLEQNYLRSLPRDLKNSSKWWQAEILRESVSGWNAWRSKNPDVKADLSGQDFCWAQPTPPYSNDAGGPCFRDLSGTNLAVADLRSACLRNSCCDRADFRRANLEGANLSECVLWNADFTDAIGLEYHQLVDTEVDESTKLPVGLARPKNWKPRTATRGTEWLVLR